MKKEWSTPELTDLKSQMTEYVIRGKGKDGAWNDPQVGPTVAALNQLGIPVGY